MWLFFLICFFFFFFLFGSFRNLHYGENVKWNLHKIRSVPKHTDFLFISSAYVYTCVSTYMHRWWRRRLLHYHRPGNLLRANERLPNCSVHTIMSWCVRQAATHGPFYSINAVILYILALNPGRRAVDCALQQRMEFLASFELSGLGAV